MITIRLVSHPGIFDWATKIALYGFWATHAEALMPDGRLLGARFSGGVQARAHDYDAGKFDQELFLTIKTTEAQEAAFYDFLRAQVGKKYDWRAIVSFFGSRDWQEPDSWFCSELMAAGLSACGFFPQHMAVKFDRITPRDLLLLASTLAEDR